MDLFLFILAGFLILAGITATVLLARAHGSDNDDAGPAAIAILAALAGLTVLFFDSFTIVPTRNVAVEVAFGKAITTDGNGWHWVAPWHSVEKFDASVQTLNLTTAKEDDGDPVTVRLGNQTTAQVDVSVQWNIDPNGDVIDLYKRYKTFDNIDHNLVKRQLQRALNTAFDRYDPLAAIGGNADRPGQSLDDLAAKAKAELQDAVGTGIQIGTVIIPIIHYDGDTENRLKAYQQALADTRIADQRKQTAQKIGEANAILAGSAATANPGVQYQNCLDMVERVAKSGGSLPAGFSCSGSPTVVIGAAAK